MAPKSWRGNRLDHRRKRFSSTVFLVLFVLLATTVVTLMLLGYGILSPSTRSDTITSRRITLLATVESEVEGSGKRGNQWTEILSWEPRAFLYHNFLSKEECEHLIDAAKPYMEKSKVIDDDTGKDVYDSARTSTGMFFTRGQDKVIEDIEKRIADYTLISAENGEGLQVLHYAKGQKYEPHHDYFEDEYNLKNGGQRAATVLMYLSEVEEGGETVFPNARVNNASSLNETTLGCAESGISVKPQMGDALLFWSLRPDATEDLSSFHGSCPVISGNKWVATKWMHVREYT